MKQAAQKSDWKAVREVAGLLDKFEADEKRKAAEELSKRLTEATGRVKGAFDTLAQFIAGTKTFDKATWGDLGSVVSKVAVDRLTDGAEGIWFMWDFGSTLTQLKLRRLEGGVKKTSSESKGTSYVPGLSGSKVLLEKVGDQVWFKEPTTVTIDKQEHVLPAGMTYTQGYDFSSNGGWRNRVHMALAKAAGEV